MQQAPFRGGGDSALGLGASSGSPACETDLAKAHPVSLLAACLEDPNAGSPIKGRHPHTSSSPKQPRPGNITVCATGARVSACQAPTAAPGREPPWGLCLWGGLGIPPTVGAEGDQQCVLAGQGLARAQPARERN